MTKSLLITYFACVCFQFSLAQQVSYQLGFEYPTCAKNSIDTTLFWYGVYQQDQKSLYELRELKIAYQQISLHGEKPFQIKTNVEGNSLFLIGTNKKLKNKTAISDYAPSKTWQFYPGQTTTIVLPTRYHQELDAIDISATGCAQSDGSNKYVDFTNYKIFLTRIKADSVFQDITPEFERASSLNVELIWCGDIDGDSKLDLLFKNLTQWEIAEFKLMLSSLASKGNLVSKSINWTSGNCY